MNTDDLMAHEEASELLPWAANRSLPLEMYEAVRKHALACVSCRRELNQLIVLDNNLARSADAIVVPPPDMRHINQRIDAHIDAQQRGARSLRSIWRFFSDPWRAAVVVQSVLLAVVASSILSTKAPDIEYTTLSDQSVLPNGDYIRAVFGPDVGAKDIDALLRSFDLLAVEGPSDRGVYTLAYRGTGPWKNHETAARLRQDARVLFAQPIDAQP